MTEELKQADPPKDSATKIMVDAHGGVMLSTNDRLALSQILTNQTMIFNALDLLMKAGLSAEQVRSHQSVVSQCMKSSSEIQQGLIVNIRPPAEGNS